MPDHLQITHENPIIRHIKSYQGRVQPHIGLGDEVSKQIRRMPLFSQMLFQPIQRRENRVQITFVRLLRTRKPSLIHPIIDRMINPLIQLINLPPQLLGIKPTTRSIPLPQLLRHKCIKLTIKHPNNLTTLITHNRLLLLIPQRRHQILALIPSLRLLIQLLQTREAIQRIFRRGTVLPGKQPAVFGEGKVTQDQLDDVFEAFERADEIGAVRPWTPEIDVECVAAFFGGELGVGIGGDEGAELAGFAPELAVGVGLFVDCSLRVFVNSTSLVKGRD